MYCLYFFFLDMMDNETPASIDILLTPQPNFEDAENALNTLDQDLENFMERTSEKGTRQVLLAKPEIASLQKIKKIMVSLQLIVLEQYEEFQQNLDKQQKKLSQWGWGFYLISICVSLFLTCWINSKQCEERKRLKFESFLAISLS
mgnify:CR=1 FL=1